MIRQGTLRDLDVIVENNRLMARETEDVDLALDIVHPGVEAVLRGDQPGQYWVVEEEGRVVAQLMLTFEWSDWRNKTVWWIQSVYVQKEARRAGHYRRLYAHVLDEARAAGAGGIRLYVDERNAAAQKVYAALGMDGEHYRVFEAML